MKSLSPSFNFNIFPSTGSFLVRRCLNRRLFKKTRVPRGRTKNHVNQENFHYSYFRGEVIKDRIGLWSHLVAPVSRGHNEAKLRLDFFAVGFR